MWTLELLLRGAAAGLLLLSAALLARDQGRTAWGRLGAAMAFGVAAYALYPPLAGRPPRPPSVAPLAALSAGVPLTFWLFSRALFDDGFRPKPWHALAWAVLAGAGVVNCLRLWPEGAAGLGMALDLAPPAFSLLAVVQALAGWRADLLEDRRRLRGTLVGLVAVYSFVLAAVRTGVPQGAAEAAGASLVESLALAALAGWAVWRLASWPAAPLLGAPGPQEAERPSMEGAARPEAKPAKLPSEELPAEPESAANALSAEDQGRLQALQRLMQQDRAYREEGLSIGRLAERLDLPEHRLRRLINQGLGFRNFNAFVNGYRLAEVRKALSDPAMAEVPVLQIAMDAGFQSLGPFNRAFKAETGVTPSEFRRRALQPGKFSLAESENG